MPKVIKTNPDKIPIKTHSIRLKSITSFASWKTGIGTLFPSFPFGMIKGRKPAPIKRRPNSFLLMSMDLLTILHELKEGNQTHFPELYEATKRPVFYNILSLIPDYGIAEDLLQETFIRFLEHLPSVRQENKILGFLMRVSKNLALDFLKKRDRMKEIECEESIPSSDRTRIDERILIERIQASLSEKEFRIFVLRVLGERTFEEIRRIVNKPLGTVLWIYNESIKKLRKELEDENVIG